MYRELVEEEVHSGARMMEIATSQGNEELVVRTSQQIDLHLTGNPSLLSPPLQRIGILSTLHCRKVRLAVAEAISDQPSPLADVDHTWVAGETVHHQLTDMGTNTHLPADWLKRIGLGCYQRSFLDGRIDGRMLNIISMVTNITLYSLTVVTPPPLPVGQEDLFLLDIVTPFHIVSLKRAIQAFRYLLGGT